MHIRIGIWLAIIPWMLAHVPAMSAAAQSTQAISGSWFANEGKIGLVLKKGDLHPYFLYGECEKPRHQVRLNLEVEPKLLPMRSREENTSSCDGATELRSSFQSWKEFF
jgi:hypothetical protein